jgi:transaldolase
MTNLQKLHTTYQQSPWLDNLSRDLVSSGQLQHYIDQGVRGLTSNPTILEKAIKSSSLYDEQIKSLAASGLTNEEIFFKITIDDIKAAAKVLEPIWHDSAGEDGYVSLEVSPSLADDTEATIAQAKQLWQEVNQPNLMIKVPATPAGVPAIKELLSININVNVTLIFSLERYKQIVTTYLETHKLNTSRAVYSVASFFVSRVDTEIDKRLQLIATNEALGLCGQAAIAQARLAYGIFLDNFTNNPSLSSDIPVQRLLWASTSTKNPTYDDLLYINKLLAPQTINTLPEETIEKIIDHLPEDARSFSTEDIIQAQETFKELRSVGIDLDDVARTLESEGVSKFQASFDSLLATIGTKKTNSNN